MDEGLKPEFDGEEPEPNVRPEDQLLEHRVVEDYEKIIGELEADSPFKFFIETEEGRDILHAIVANTIHELREEAEKTSQN